MLYYLYSGQSYWTMSPDAFIGWFRSDNIQIYLDGSLKGDSSQNWKGVRPVINIDPDKITFTGNGTMQDPYVIS